MDVVIDWERPYKLRAFLDQPELKARFDKPGVYLRVERLPDGTHRLGYVGRALGRPTLWRRQRQHYACMIGGLYTIPKEFRRCGRTWVPDSAETVETMLDRVAFTTVVEEGFRYAEACDVYVWITPPGFDPDVVERNLLYDLRPSGTDWGKNSIPAVRLKIGHRSPRWLTSEIRGQLRDACLIV